MKRKFIWIFLFCGLFFMSETVFSIDVSIGFIGNYVFNDSHISFKFDDNTKSDLKINSYNNSLGVKSFLDFSFLELSIGAVFDVDSYARIFKGLNISLKDADSRLHSKVQYLTLEALLKAPIKLGRVHLYPLIGCEVDIPLSGESITIQGLKNDLKKQMEATGSDFLKEFSKFWGEAGLGMDIFLGKNLFLRTEALFGINFNFSSNEAKILNSLRQTIEKKEPNFNYFTLIYKIDARLGLGYKF